MLWSVAVLVLGSLLCSPTRADELDRWVWRNPRPLCSQVYSLVQGNGLWLALANAGVLATSIDGIDWDLANVRTNSFLIAGAFGNGRFAVASSRGPIFSFDAHTWSRAATNINLNDLAFGNGLFVAVNGQDATVWRSADGSNWVHQAVGFLNHYDQVSFANQRFFILGGDSSYQNYLLYSSADATNWAGPVDLGTNAIKKIAFGNGVYASINSVLTPPRHYSQVRTSPDGSTWSAPLDFDSRGITDLLFAEGRFLAVDVEGRIFTSPDGATWAEHSAPETVYGGKVLWNGKLYVASGLSGSIASSINGLTWVRRTLGFQNSLMSVIHTNGLFVAVGSSPTAGGADFLSQNIICISSNGRDWTEQRPPTTNALYAITYAAGQYLAVGGNGAILSSTDALNWNPSVSPTTDTLTAVAFGAGQFVAVGGVSNRATIINSPDGLNWTNQPDALLSAPLTGLTYAQGQFVAVGLTNAANSATILTSPDGFTWTPRLPNSSNHLYAVTFANGNYVAVGFRSLLTSTNGITWSSPFAGVNGALRTVAYAHGWYIATGTPPVLYTSTNAVDWVFRPAFDLVTRNSLFSIVDGDDSVFAVGLFGQVLESALFHPPAPAVTVQLRQAGVPCISFTGPELHTYEIQYANALPPVWQPLTTLINLTAATTLPDLTATNATSRFYRARLVQ